MDKKIILDALPPNERYRTLLNKLSSKEISLDAEFDTECAYWLIVCDDLYPWTLPLRPQKLLNYDGMFIEKRKKVTSDFWRQDIIYNYLEKKQTVLNRNRELYQKLIEFKQYIPKEDIVTRSKYDFYISKYIDFFNYMPDVGKQKWQWHDKKLPQDVQEVADKFGGEVVPF